MANISKSGITPHQQIKAEHLTRIIDALSGLSNTDILISGSLGVWGKISGSIDHSANITNLDYPQKIYVDNIISSSLGVAQDLQSVLDNGNSVSYIDGSNGQLFLGEDGNKIVSFTIPDLTGTSFSKLDIYPDTIRIVGNNNIDNFPNEKIGDVSVVNGEVKMEQQVNATNSTKVSFETPIASGIANLKFPAKPAGDYIFALLEDITTVDTAFYTIPYLSVLSVPFIKTTPNFEIHLTGNLDLTLTGTVNGDLGLVNLYFTSTEVATLNGFTTTVITGSGVMIPLYFIHDADGVKWYSDSVGGNFIPLSGTTVGNPVTGDIEMSASISKIYSGDLPSLGQLRSIEFTDEGTLKLSNVNENSNSQTNLSLGIDSDMSYQEISTGKFLRFLFGSTYGFQIQDELFNRGIGGTQDFSPNITTLDYTQKIYVDKNFATQTGTTLWHSAIATNVGTFSNVGSACTGTGTAITAEMIGAKITKANGEIGIIATRASNTSFTVIGFTTDSVATSFVVNVIAYKINTDGSVNNYDKLGNLRFYMDVDGNTSNNYLIAQTNGNITVNGYQLNLQDTVYLNGNGYVIAPFLQNRIIYTVATLPTPSAAGVYASVSDALTPTYLGALVGGGAVTCPVYFNGTIWVTH